jgi:hypothetical protein
VPSSIRFNIDNGVSAANVEAIWQGIAIVHNYLETMMGGDEASNWPNLTVSIFNATSNESCCLGLTEGHNGLYEPGPRFYTLHPEWRNRNAMFPGGLSLEHQKHSAHEYTHAWQGALGCVGGQYGQPLGRWLTEGMAEYAAWNSLVQAGQLTREQVATFHVNSALSQSSYSARPDFKSWEDPDNPFHSWAYNYAYLAVEKLVTEAGGSIILRMLCDEAARVAPVTNIRDYLNLAIVMKNLGIDRDGFYDELPSYFAELFRK